MQVKDSPLLLQQIDALQLSIKHLQSENNRLKVRGPGGGAGQDSWALPHGRGARQTQRYR